MTVSQPFLIFDLKFLSLCSKSTNAATSFLFFDDDFRVVARFVGKVPPYIYRDGSSEL